MLADDVACGSNSMTSPGRSPIAAIESAAWLRGVRLKANGISGLVSVEATATGTRRHAPWPQRTHAAQATQSSERTSTGKRPKPPRVSRNAFSTSAPRPDTGSTREVSEMKRLKGEATFNRTQSSFAIFRIFPRRPVVQNPCAPPPPPTLFPHFFFST